MWGAPSAVGASAETGPAGCLPRVCASATCLCLGRVFVVQAVSAAPVCVHMHARVPVVPVSESPHVPARGAVPGSGAWADGSHGWVCVCSGPKFLMFCGVVIMIHMKTCILPFSFCIAVCPGKTHRNIPSLSVYSSGVLSVLPELYRHHHKLISEHFHRPPEKRPRERPRPRQ